MSTHIDQMSAWWDEAAPGIPKMGDTYIEDERHRGSSFRIVEAATDHKYGFENIRILHRAPAPKPAWHNAVAVIASHVDSDHRSTWTPDPYLINWWTTDDDARHADDLRNVTPLIEAKVTDEMCDRVRDYYRTEQHVELPRDDVWLNDLLTVALGVDPA